MSIKVKRAEELIGEGGHYYRVGSQHFFSTTDGRWQMLPNGDFARVDEHGKLPAIVTSKGHWENHAAWNEVVSAL